MPELIRLVPIVDAKVRELYDQIIGFQRSILPELREMEEISIKMEELKARHKELASICEVADGKAKRVKDKLVPRLQKALAKDMGDFDEFVGLDIEGDVLNAKIQDKVEVYKDAILKQKAEALAKKG